jgi:hypothetical protein
MLQQARHDKAAEAATLRQVAAQRSLSEAKALLSSDVILAAQKLRIAKPLDPEIEGYLELLHAVSDRARSLGEAALAGAKQADLSRNNVLAITEYEKAIQLLEVIPGGHKDLHAVRQRLAELKIPQQLHLDGDS